MTREEIRQEAEEGVNICTPYHTGSFIQGYIAGAEPRENKIADIKANCDLAIEGRDVKIMELEQQIEEMKSDVRTNIKWADQKKNNQMYCKLNSMINQWEIEEK